MTTDTATLTAADDVMAMRPCPECPADEGRQVGPLDERCPRCAALGEWSLFVELHHPYRDFDLVDANPDGWIAEINAVYGEAHLEIFGVACSDACGLSEHVSSAAEVTRYRIPSETYAAMRLADYRRRRGLDRHVSLLVWSAYVQYSGIYSKVDKAPKRR